MSAIPKSDWQWFGHPGHFICADDCRFHLCTKVGDYLISTVGEMFPDESTREVYAKSRGITLEGRGDYRKADFLKKHSWVEIGYNRKYETMVFKAGEPCTAKDCNCGLPKIDGRELDAEPANDAATATQNHYALCFKWSQA